MSRSKETVRAFRWEGDAAPVADAWAGDQGFEILHSDDGLLRYRLASSWGDIDVYVLCVSASQADGEVVFRFWILYNRGLLLYLLPSATGIESGGFRGSAPRRRARAAANDLLDRFGQPPIE